MLIIVVGCGKMGALVSNTLSNRGESVIVIDREESSFDNLSPEFSGFKIAGDATQVEILRHAKIKQADTLLVLTDDDNINLTIAQVGAKYFKVKNTIARVVDPFRQGLYDQLGISTICPTTMSVFSLMEKLESLK